MALRSNWSEATCPIARSLDVLGDPWSLLVLREVFTGAQRYDVIKQRLVGVSDSVLSGRLRSLEGAGILGRKPYGGEVRPRFEYFVTERGADVLPVLNALAVWGMRHTSGLDMRIWCVRCGDEAVSADWCPTCRARLDIGSTGWVRGGIRDQQFILEDAGHVRSR